MPLCTRSMEIQTFGGLHFKAYLVLEKGLSLINENQNLYCEYMFCV